MLNKLLKRQFFRYFTARFAGTVVVTLAGITNSILTARLLGTEGKGIYFLIYTTLTMSIAVAGLKLGFSQVFHRQHTSLKVIASTTVYISLFAGAFAMIASAAFVYSLQDTVYKGIPSDYTLFAIVAVPLLLMARNVRGILDANYNVYKATIVDTSRSLLFLLGFSTAALLGLASIESALVSMIISITGMLLLAFWMVGQKTSLSIKNISTDLKKKMTKFAIKSHIGTLFRRMQDRLDVFLIAFFMTPADLGIYSVALAVSEVTGRFSTVASNVLLSKLAKTGQNKKSIRITAKLNRVILAFTLASVIIIALLCEWIVRIAFGDEFMGSVNAIRYLLPGIIAVSIFRIMNTNLIIRGKPGSFSLIVALGVIIMLIGDVLLIPRYGINGAAIASSLAYITSASIICIMVIAKNDLKIREYFVCIPELRTLFQYATKRKDV